VIFVQIFDYLGPHVPALGAFLVCLLVVAVLCFLFYKLGRHEANKKWSRDVECMPQVIEQDVREKMEKRIVALDVRNKYLQERNDAMMPAFKSLAIIAEVMLEERGRKT
jgi:hypothetical protein